MILRRPLCTFFPIVLNASSSSSAFARRAYSRTYALKMMIVPVPVRTDNYAYLVINDAATHAAVVDPYDMIKVETEAEKYGVEIVANLTTHHHHDHSGGNKAFALKHPNAPIYGGSNNGDNMVNRLVKDKVEFTIGDQLNVRCLATPCHTEDSICYYVTDKANPSQPGAVFTGDTLFIGGCGRFFEGDGGQMHNALSYLATLPDNTIVYNGHEYTSGNLAFGRSIEPMSSGTLRLQKLADTFPVTTGKSTIGDEKDWNVFMRLGSLDVLEAVGATHDTPKGEAMKALRALKNDFKG